MMAQFKFIYDDGDTNIEYTVDKEHLPEIVDAFRYFLRAVSFSDSQIAKYIKEEEYNGN